MIKREYGYKMFNCTLQEWHNHDLDSYAHRVSHTPDVRFGYVKFNSIDEAVGSIKNVFVPAEHGQLGEIKWRLDEDQTLLTKTISFSNDDDSRLYQLAIERAWALGGHLDPRVEQLYYD